MKNGGNSGLRRRKIESTDDFEQKKDWTLWEEVNHKKRVKFVDRLKFTDQVKGSAIKHCMYPIIGSNLQVISLYM